MTITWETERTKHGKWPSGGYIGKIRAFSVIEVSETFRDYKDQPFALICHLPLPNLPVNAPQKPFYAYGKTVREMQDLAERVLLQWLDDAGLAIEWIDVG
jgi:hypothetical protein